eukprot:4133370-Prymnesium_polylepis.1
MYLREHPSCMFSECTSERANLSYYLIGDDAYPASHTLAVPWPGKWPSDSPQVAYNYHHSQARMAVEQ